MSELFQQSVSPSANSLTRELRRHLKRALNQLKRQEEVSPPSATELGQMLPKLANVAAIFFSMDQLQQSAIRKYNAAGVQLSDAEELGSHFALELLKSIAKGPSHWPSGNAGAWKVIIEKRVLFRYWRQSRKRQLTNQDFRSESGPCCEDEGMARIDYLDSLSKKQRSVVELLFDGLGCGEIAVKLGVSEKHVRNILQRLKPSR